MNSKAVPPFQEEDDSFFDPEEDSSDSLLKDDLEPSESVLPSDLDERVTAYLQAHGISTEPEHESNSHLSPTLPADYSSIWG